MEPIIGINFTSASPSQLARLSSPLAFTQREGRSEKNIRLVATQAVLAGLGGEEAGGASFNEGAMSLVYIASTEFIHFAGLSDQQLQYSVVSPYSLVPS
jgi:hypothetical protein